MISLSGYRRGQYFSFDAIIASVIFVLTLVMLLSYWHSVRTYLDYQANDLNKEATRLSNLLFTPPNGTCSSMGRLGLAISFTDKRMNETLLSCMNGVAANDLQAYLGAAYNVSIVVTDTYYSPNKVWILGPDPGAHDFSANLTEISKVRRIGTLASSNGQDHIATVDLYVYR